MSDQLIGGLGPGGQEAKPEEGELFLLFCYFVCKSWVMVRAHKADFLTRARVRWPRLRPPHTGEPSAHSSTLMISTLMISTPTVPSRSLDARKANPLTACPKSQCRGQSVLPVWEFQPSHLPAYRQALP